MSERPVDMRFAPLLVLIVMIGCVRNQNLKIAREQRAITTIVELNRTEAEFYARFGRYGELSELNGPSKSPGPYSIKLNVGHGSYTITVTAPALDMRSFFSDQTMTIRQSTTLEPANANSPEIK